jgi:hypothetical protein
MDGRAAAGAQLQVTGDEVGVEVAEKDVAVCTPNFSASPRYSEFSVPESQP